jgi:tRNA(fMet)-specific endonuclease VapC
VKPVLLDTDVLSFYLKGSDEGVVALCRRHSALFGRLSISIITHYEVLSGLHHRAAAKRLDDYRRFAAANNVLPLTAAAVERAAVLYADLRTRGTPVDDIDLLIAGIALENRLPVATGNRSHFERIAGLDVQIWSTAARDQLQPAAQDRKHPKP